MGYTARLNEQSVAARVAADREDSRRGSHNRTPFNKGKPT